MPKYKAMDSKAGLQSCKSLDSRWQKPRQSPRITKGLEYQAVQSPYKNIANKLQLKLKQSKFRVYYFDLRPS